LCDSKLVAELDLYKKTLQTVYGTETRVCYNGEYQDISYLRGKEVQAAHKFNPLNTELNPICQ